MIFMSFCSSTSNFYFISGLIKMELSALNDLSHYLVRYSASYKVEGAIKTMYKGVFFLAAICSLMSFCNFSFFPSNRIL